MTLDEYQYVAMGTALPTANEVYRVVGAGAEMGELLAAYAKYVRGDFDREEFKRRLVGELGDNLWFIAAVADEFQLDLESIAQYNIEKLQKRKAENKLKGDGDER